MDSNLLKKPCVYLKRNEKSELNLLRARLNDDFHLTLYFV